MVNPEKKESKPENLWENRSAEYLEGFLGASKELLWHLQVAGKLSDEQKEKLEERIGGIETELEKRKERGEK